jgi:recombination protein RecT
MTEGTLVTQEEAYESVQKMLARVDIQSQISGILPQHVTAEKLNNLVLVQFRKTPKLFMQCDRQSLLGAILETCQLGLEIGTSGHCWIVPFYNSKRQVHEATLMIGYRGMIDLAWRSDKIKAVSARVVHEGDEFQVVYGIDPVLAHTEPPEGGKGNVKFVYAVVETALGGKMFDVMSKGDIEGIRKRSRQGDSGPWVFDYDEMAKKTVLRRVLKLAPSSTELQRAVTLDYQAEIGEAQGLEHAIDVTPDADDEVPTSPTPTDDSE